MAESTAQMILKYLNQHLSATAAELSEALSITRADVRYHLAKLKKSGLIEVHSVERKHPGRPERRFQLCTSTKPHNYPQLLIAILSNASSHQWVLSAPKIFLDSPFSGPMPLRLNQCVNWLNQHNYQASWIAGQKGPIIRFRNCPYASLLPDHCILCDMDRSILEYALSAQVLTKSLFYSSDFKFPGCVFEVKIEPH